MKELQTKHEEEIARLERKLKWYAENQEMLDRDALALKRKDEEIQELRETVSSLQKQAGQNASEKDKRHKERTTDARRIQDLQRQVMYRLMRTLTMTRRIGDDGDDEG